MPGSDSDSGQCGQSVAMSGPLQPDILRVSLEPHLVEKLRPLVRSIPAPLSAELSPLLSETASSSTPTISHALLSSLSRWVRTEEGARELKSNDPPLDPLAYSMVALLAGTRTSPDKKFPQSSPRPFSRSESAARDIGDRRAIIAVLNALLSVICTGAATWWAAQRTGWRDEWVCYGVPPFASQRDAAENRIQKVLLSLLAATIVAMSEVGLYIIWEARRRGLQPAAETKADLGRTAHDYSVGDANSHNVSEDTSPELVRLGDTQSQASTSIDPHQPNASIALRQRIGAPSKSRPR
jgi:hypothetical protein